jgi:hypothetical protein
MPFYEAAPIATVENMRRAESGAVAITQDGRTFSATAGDYFWLTDEDPLTDEEGLPLRLVVAVTTYRPAELT